MWLWGPAAALRCYGVILITLETGGMWGRKKSSLHCYGSRPEKRSSLVWVGGQEKRMSFDKRKKEEGVGALLLGGSFFVFVLCMT